VGKGTDRASQAAFRTDRGCFLVKQRVKRKDKSGLEEGASGGGLRAGRTMGRVKKGMRAAESTG